MNKKSQQSLLSTSQAKNDENVEDEKPETRKRKISGESDGESSEKKKTKTEEEIKPVLNAKTEVEINSVSAFHSFSALALCRYRLDLMNGSSSRITDNANSYGLQRPTHPVENSSFSNPPPMIPVSVQIPATSQNVQVKPTVKELSAYNEPPFNRV